MNKIILTKKIAYHDGYGYPHYIVLSGDKEIKPMTTLEYNEKYIWGIKSMTKKEMSSWRKTFNN